MWSNQRLECRCLSSFRSFRFSKKFFWFGNEAVDPKSLATYLKSEKAEIAHPTAAHAIQTGKGLLFYAKRVEDKAHPAGVLNLVSFRLLVHNFSITGLTRRFCRASLPILLPRR